MHVMLSLKDETFLAALISIHIVKPPFGLPLILQFGDTGVFVWNTPESPDATPCIAVSVSKRLEALEKNLKHRGGGVHRARQCHMDGTHPVLTNLSYKN